MTKALPCKHPGCKYSSRSKGLCSKHGTPRVRGFCKYDKWLSQCRGKERLCFRHRTIDDSNTSPTVVKTQNRQICSFDGCDKFARGKHRLCSKHYKIKNNTILPSTNRKRTLNITPDISILKNQVDA